MFSLEQNILNLTQAQNALQAVSGTSASRGYGGFQEALMGIGTPLFFSEQRQIEQLARFLRIDNSKFFGIPLEGRIPEFTQWAQNFLNTPFGVFTSERYIWHSRYSPTYSIDSLLSLPINIHSEGGVRGEGDIQGSSLLRNAVLPVTKHPFPASPFFESKQLKSSRAFKTLPRGEPYERKKPHQENQRKIPFRENSVLALVGKWLKETFPGFLDLFSS